MGTRAAAFNAKIQNLLDIHLRLLHGVVPSPSGHDIASTLKYFSQTLLGVLKDIQASPFEMIRHLEQDPTRLSLFPCLDYKGLHSAISQLVNVIPLVQFGTHGIRPVGDPEENLADSSIAAVLMTLLQYSSNTSHHTQLLECFMSLKQNILTEMFSIVAHGTPRARPAAANLLFFYWPNFNPTLYDRRGFHIRIADISSVLKAMFNRSAQAAKSDSVSQADSAESKAIKGWKRLVCQMEDCEGEGRRESTKVCYDHSICLGICPEAPPPLHMCSGCATGLINKESCADKLLDMLAPIGQVVAGSCENKNCRSTEKNAVATCFSTECTSYNGNKPIRLCAQCNTIRHNTRRGADHIMHTVISSVWTLDNLAQSYVIETIVSLLNEAQPLGDKAKGKDQERLSRACLLEEENIDTLTVEDRRQLSRFGVWLLVGLCVPSEDTPIPILGRLLGALFCWFNATQYLPDDQQGMTIERLKTEYIHNWLQDVCKTHFDVFVSTLLPHPVEYAKVGGHWDTLATKGDHIKEGFRRLFCLVPYDLITIAVWERIMCHWMEAIHNDVSEKDLIDLKITLSKLLDPEMSPLGFDSTQMYNFISKRFSNSSQLVQEQTLSWLQLLSSLNITIPIYQLIEMLQEGVKALLGRKSDGAAGDLPLEPVIEDESDAEGGELIDEGVKRPANELQPEVEQTHLEKTLTCFVLMFDVFLKQLEVQEIEKHKGVNGPVAIPFLTLMKDMLLSPCLAPHLCNGDQYCTTCDLTITYFQLTMDILAYLLPLLAIQNNRVIDMIPPEPQSSREPNKIPEQSGLSAKNGPPKPSAEAPPPASDPSSRADAATQPQIVTAKEETVGLELDMVSNMPQENVMAATATEVTITEEDVANAHASVGSASVVGANDEIIDCTKSIDGDSFWVTSQGKFKFKLEQLPPHLQVIYSLLLLLEKAEDGDVVFHLCECLRYLILHGESLAQAASEHRGFLIWCQEHKHVTLMWSLLVAEWSHVGEISTALLLHFLTLPCGADLFWKLCQNHFHNSDWKVRFQAVEKVVVIARFLTVASVKQCPGLQAAIAHAFCYLMASLDDIHVAVAQRAHLYLTSLPDSGIKALTWCLEQQFDNVILDRPMIIQVLYQLSCLLPDRKILSWEFFYNRFDAQYVETQIALEKRGEIAFPRDLRNSDLTSDIFARKLNRAQDALCLVQNASAKTLSSSLGTKWPYKRTMSTSANMFNRVDKQERTMCRVEALDGGMKVFDDGSMVHQLQLALDLEETDFDTLHLLIFLLMHFVSQPEHVGNNDSDDKSNVKVMNLVLRHLSLLIGFSPQERSFVITPSKLRSSPVFNSFLSNLPKVLDHNFVMGKQLLPTCMSVLQYSPAPHKMTDVRYPTYSLWYLQPHPRRWWLTSVLTIMYKFDYTQHLLSTQILSLIRIVLLTLENHFHRCRKVIDRLNLPHSREVSQASVGGEPGEKPHEGTPPPLSPNAGAVGDQIRGGGRAGSAPVVPASIGVLDHKSAFKPVDEEQRSSVELRKTLDAIPQSPRAREEEEEEENAGDFVSFNSPVLMEEAAVRIEDHESAGPDLGLVHGVTSVMASQIQAFDESFTVKIHDAELVQGSFEVSSETFSIDENNQSWSTDLEQFAQLSGSQPSFESECMHLNASSVFTPQDQLKNRESFSGTSGQVSPTSQWSVVNYAFQPIQKTNKRPSFKEDENLIRGSSLSSDQDSSSNGVHIQTIHIQEQDIIAAEGAPQQYLLLDSNILHAQPKESSTRLAESNDSKSPLSMMDLITLGSPVQVDGSSVVDPASPKILELPTPERLLQTGFEQGITEAISLDRVGSANLRKDSDFLAFHPPPNSRKNFFSKEAELREVVALKEFRGRKDMERGSETCTDDASESSLRVAGSSPAGAGELLSRSKNGKSNSNLMGWEDLGNNYYSWSDEQSEGYNRGSQPPVPPSSTIKQSSLRIGEDCMVYRCLECGEVLEEFSNEDLGMCIIILATFVHREPGLAAPLLPRMLKTVSRVAGSEVFNWQYESAVHLPGSATSVGRQFLRCVLHQLSPNQIFNQIFQSDIPDAHRAKLFKTLAQALTDFNELNPSAPISSLLENLSSSKSFPTEHLDQMLGNLAAYMECTPLEGNAGLSTALVPLFDAFLRKVQLNVSSLDNFDNMLRLLINIFKVQGIAAHKSILDPMAKLLSYAIQNAPLKYEHLSELCYLCTRIFTRERDKLLLSRLVTFELVQALKFKTTVPDTNVVILIQMLLQDSGGTLGQNNVLEDLPQEILDSHNQHNANLAECMRTHLQDSIEFVADVHTITKVKAMCQSTFGLNEDTVGGLIKAGMAQYLAIEITRGNSRDSRTLIKYLPWLQSAPTALQQGPKEFIECVVHIRLLSWLLLGSLTHTCLVGSTSSLQCQPVPPEASCHIADHIQVILAGFPEHSKNTVQHMSSLYQTFILAQLWTLYLEQGAGSPASESHSSISAILTNFWVKITPSILQLVSHSKVVGEMVALHLMSLMEALQQCQSSVLTKLLPLWAPVLYTQHAKQMLEMSPRGLKTCLHTDFYL